MQVGITGINGRISRLLAEEVVLAGHSLTGGTIRPGSENLSQPIIPLIDTIEQLANVSEMIIDFTHSNAVRHHATTLAVLVTPWVLGTTGLSSDDEIAVQEAATRIPVMHAPNYAPCVTLMLALAERMAASLPAALYDAEIVELHHRHKRDAPSGTALGLGRAVAAGRGQVLQEVMESGRHGETGPRKPGAIGFAALRGGEVAGEHTVLFASATEHISINHRAFDRRVFAAGAVQAAEWLYGKPPGLYSMRDVLGLA